MALIAAQASGFRCELDSHADMCCVGKNAHILHEWPNRKVKATPFLSTLGHVPEAPIVSALIVYDEPSLGAPIFLIIHQAVYFADLDHLLLCPMQLRHNAVIVNDRPKHCTENPTIDDHCVIIKMDDLRIPLDLVGVTSYFPRRQPTSDELK